MTFRAIAKRADRGTKRITSLDHCAAVRTPSQAFAAVIALLPAVLIDLVNEIKPQLLGLRRTLAGMRPHSRLFGRWLAAVEQNLSLILRFDNHGKKIDYCRAAKVMLAKSSTAHDIERVLGIDPALVALLFRGGSSAPGQTLQSLNAKMRVFLVAAGLSRHQAATLTSSY